MIETTRNEWSAWETYTPTLGGGLSLGTGGTRVGHFRRAGTTGQVDIVVTLGTSGGGGAGPYTLSLPTGWAAANTTNRGFVGGLMLNDTGTATHDGRAYVVPGGTVIKCYVVAASGSYASWQNTTSTVPFTWTSTDFIVASMRLELAP